MGETALGELESHVVGEVDPVRPDDAAGLQGLRLTEEGVGERDRVDPLVQQRPAAGAGFEPGARVLREGDAEARPQAPGSPTRPSAISCRSRRKAGLNFIHMASMRKTPRSAASANRSAASAALVAIGFSTSTFRPASSACRVIAWWVAIGVAR